MAGLIKLLRPFSNGLAAGRPTSLQLFVVGGMGTTRLPSPAFPLPSHSHSAKPLVTLQVRNSDHREAIWFNANFPLRSDWRPPQPGGDPEEKKPDERKVKLGKTLRILQERLPTLLQTPLPQEVLSPNISLHLFPSTHPHLPTVSGRVAYIAALWTSPIAWNRMPLIGNVKLQVLSERMVSSPIVSSRRKGAEGEQLVVRWCTVGRTSRNWALSFIHKIGGGGSATSPLQKRPVGMAEATGSSREFTGLFIFDFDAEGRILSHTIEHAQHSGHLEEGVGSKFVGLTDWLLSGMKGSNNGPLPVFVRKHYHIK